MTNDQLKDLMERVRRYEFVYDYSDTRMRVDDNGEFVTFDDYESLARRVLAAENLVHSLKCDIMTMDSDTVRLPHLKRRAALSRKALEEYKALK